VADVTVQARHEPATLKGMVMIVYRDIASKPVRRCHFATGADAAPSADLQQSCEEAQTLREQALASKEELQSTNEELKSSNDELQSANEELQFATKS